jgi:dihydroorotase
MSVRPARIGGLAEHGRSFEAGAPANVVLVDPAASRVVEPNALHSLSRNTPYAGMKLPGAVVATLLRGSATVLDGRVVER